VFERPRDVRLAFVFTIRHGRRRFVLLLESVRVRRRFVQRRSRGIVSEILRKRESESARAAQRSARVSLVEQNMKTERARLRIARCFAKAVYARSFERFALTEFPFLFLSSIIIIIEKVLPVLCNSKCASHSRHKAKGVFLFPLSFPLSFITNSLRAHLNNKER
jgi:hypothetical protein